MSLDPFLVGLGKRLRKEGGRFPTSNTQTLSPLKRERETEREL